MGWQLRQFLVPIFWQRVSEWEEGHFERTCPAGQVRWGRRQPPLGAGAA